MPARSAASVFSFTPPIGSTSPRSEISPVIATSERTGMPVRSDTSARNIATPALGPSLGVAQHGADFALEVAHAGLACVVADDGAQGLVGNGGFLGTQPVGLELPFNQVALGDLELLLLGVARELDDLHAVAQRPGDRVEH